MVYEDGYVRLFSQNVEITSNLAIHTAFLWEGVWYDSHGGHWDYFQQEQTIVFVISWDALGVRQRWTFTPETDGMRWNIEMEAGAWQRIERIQAGIVLTERYEHWFCGDEEGVLTSLAEEWRRVSLQNEEPRVVGLIGTDELPGIACTSDGAQRVLLESPPGKIERSRIIHFEKDINTLATRSTMACFALTMKVLARNRFNSSKKKEQNRIKSLREIFGDGVVVRVEKCGVHIFYQHQRVTCGRGLYTSFHAEGNHYCSFQPERDMIFQKQSDAHMRVTIDFRPHCQVKQIWDLMVAKEGVIRWKVTLEAFASVNITQRRAGIAVSDAYERGFNILEAFPFDREFVAEKEFAIDGGDALLGVYPQAQGPGIALVGEPGAFAGIQNSGASEKARLLFNTIVQEHTIGDTQGSMMDFFKGDLTILPLRNDVEKFIDALRPAPLPVEIITLFDSSPRIHDRIAGQGAFALVQERIQVCKRTHMPFRLHIAITRYNFFKLHEILQYALGQCDRTVDLSTVKLTIFPVKLLWRHITDYIDLLKVLIMPLDTIEFVWQDRELLPIIAQVQRTSVAGDEDDVLRILGVICEHAFVGPQVAVVDPFHRCNANCIHCWVHMPSITHSSEFLDRKFEFPKFTQMVDDMASLHTHKIIFQGDGEPLLYDKFRDMVRYVRSKDIKVSFFTNGILLDKKTARDVIAWGVDEIFCSMPAGTASTYKRIVSKQPPETFDAILQNLSQLSDIKKTEGNRFPRLIMTHVIHHLNVGELMAMAQNDIRVGADVARFYLVRLDENIKFLQLSPHDIALLRESYAKVKEYVKDQPIELLDTTDFQLHNLEETSGSWSKAVFLENGCPLGWHFCLVPASGDISMCCHLRTVGYLSKNSFKEIWQSEEYEQFRYQAKYMKENLQVRFLNGVQLFDEHCEHCDTHQVIRNIWATAKTYGLAPYVKQ